MLESLEGHPLAVPHDCKITFEVGPDNWWMVFDHKAASVLAFKIEAANSGKTLVGWDLASRDERNQLNPFHIGHYTFGYNTPNAMEPWIEYMHQLMAEGEIWDDYVCLLTESPGALDAIITQV